MSLPPDQALLAAIVDSSNDGIVSKTLAGVITSWNRSAERIFGFTAAEAIGSHISLIFPPERLVEEDHLLSEISAGRRVEHFKTERRHKDGHLVSVSVTLSPVRDAAGVIVGASKIVRDITPTLKLEALAAEAQAALTESRDVLSLAMRGGRMGAWARNFSTGTVWWSHELEELFGLSHDAFQGQEEDFLSLVHSDDRPLVEQAVRTAILSTHDYVVEFRFRHASGDWRWMEGRGRATYNEDGTPHSLYGVGIDINERKMFEAELAKARSSADAEAQRLNLALDAARLGDWRWDTTTDIVTFSTRGAAMLGLPPGRPVTGESMREMLHPDDREHVERIMRQSMAERSAYSVEYRLIDGGHERWIVSSGRPSYDAGGQIEGMYGVIQDVTADRLLLHLDDAVRSLEDPKDVTSTAVSVLGAHLRVHRCAYATVEDDENTFVVTANYTDGADTLVGRFKFRHFGEECLRYVREGKPFVVADTAHDPRIGPTDRSAYQAAAVGAMVLVPIHKGDRLVAAMAAHMMTPRKWEAPEVDLVQRVANRCGESIERARIEHERLVLLEAAEAANRAKDEFLAMLGHELRNPLSPIVTALQLMKLRADTSTVRERTIIERQVGHMTRLVDDLLDVSRIARGKVELKSDIVELAEVVTTAIDVARPLLEQRTQTLVVDMPKSSLPVRGDAIRLQQVVGNLLTNAAKYTPAGGRITVSCATEDGRILLRVRDTGIGMAPDLVPRVFDLFHQGRQGLDRAEGGLGLGLSIVRSLVERHGGSVSAWSEGPGKGSEFVVQLPRTERSLPISSARAHVPPVNGRKETARLLIVDDNEDSAELLAEAFRLMGHQVVTVHDGPSALAVARTTPVDAAFLDIGLPGMDGYELASRIRELPGGRDTCLVAVTGYGQGPDRQRSRGAGFDHHMVKPVDLATLEQLVNGLPQRANNPG